MLEDSADIRGMCMKIYELLCVVGTEVHICVWEPVCWGWGPPTPQPQPSCFRFQGGER